jgi:hypothetical protein
MSWVLYSEKLGVYLGSGEQTAFWSKLQPAPIEQAPCFETPQAIEALVNGWGPIPQEIARGLQHVLVVPDISAEGRFYASPSACIAAGLPGWVTPYAADAHEFIYGERPRVH